MQSWWTEIMSPNTLTTSSTETSRLSGSLKMAFCRDKHRYPYTGITLVDTKKRSLLAVPCPSTTRRCAGGALTFPDGFIWLYHRGPKKDICTWVEVCVRSK